MKIKVRVADPAGNITIFVMTALEKESYPGIARQILERQELGGEQVAFVERTEQGTLRMEMMGGEFCGNASRSFAYLLCQLSGRERQECLVDVSGSPKPLRAVADTVKKTSQVDMPLPKETRLLELGPGEIYDMRVFDGICHIIVPGKPKKGEFVEKLLEKAKAECPCGAWGIMFLEREQLIPAVYVESTDSLIWESSCGSGSMAAAVYLSRSEENGEFTYILKQPGGEIQAAVQKEQGEILRCIMGGPVSISPEIELELENKEVGKI